MVPGAHPGPSGGLGADELAVFRAPNHTREAAGGAIQDFQMPNSKCLEALQRGGGGCRLPGPPHSPGSPRPCTLLGGACGAGAGFAISRLAQPRTPVRLTDSSGK